MAVIETDLLAVGLRVAVDIEGDMVPLIRREVESRRSSAYADHLDIQYCILCQRVDIQLQCVISGDIHCRECQTEAAVRSVIRRDTKCLAVFCQQSGRDSRLCVPALDTHRYIRVVIGINALYVLCIVRRQICRSRSGQRGNLYIYRLCGIIVRVISDYREGIFGVSFQVRNGDMSRLSGCTTTFCYFLIAVQHAEVNYTAVLLCRNSQGSREITGTGYRSLYVRRSLVVNKRLCAIEI